MDVDVTAVQEEPGTTTLVVVGSVDLASKDELLDAGQRELSRDQCQRLVLDLSGVEFMDSSGIGVLITLDNDAHSRGRQIAMRAPAHRVTRLLALSGLSSRFAVVP